MTYSVVARCPDTGALGVATQTKNLAVGAQVPWLQPGLGAVATQAGTNLRWALEVMDRFVDEPDAAAVLADVVHADPDRTRFQIGIVGTNGSVAAFTGDACIPFAGHVTLPGAVLLANLMANPGVPEAMADSWELSAGDPFHLRLLDALDAAQIAGGDVRGRQSAAIHIAYSSDPADYTAALDVRVDDHPEPLVELRRLVGLRVAQRELEACTTWDEARAHPGLTPEDAVWFAAFFRREGRPEEADAALAFALTADPALRALADRLENR